ncbi:hypothetical protein WK81_07445 [Burkholderia ubonensis]|uniref:DUF4148 domain-containing protein n=1 Tax=Burkholderia ubonensis TaxID=101571 RepID=UPI00075D57CA|nr:DUF4148 domain-containing protein [Burkholderia ubonensis]KVV46428.1 hypothetical protein WK81_07160 [Burkholderia ubonensis]KVV46483.1 hypothetical protein WK81_07445 [Burkholderia ubonensis]
MNKRTMIASLILFAGAGIAVSAPAQEKTRAQVRQELIDAQRNGLNFITDTSYPVVAPIFEQQVNRLKQQNSGMGAAMTGTSETGRVKRQTPPSDPATCVGPVSFCDIYSGS